MIDIKNELSDLVEKDVLSDLVGEKITNVFGNTRYIRFQCESGKTISYKAVGDCCSETIFHDFIGVDKLLKNGIVAATYPIKPGQKEVDSDSDSDSDSDKNFEISYGYAIVSVSEEFGDMTSVFSFRNLSNGYYYGWLEKTDEAPENLPEISGEYVEFRDFCQTRRKTLEQMHNFEEALTAIKNDKRLRRLVWVDRWIYKAHINDNKENNAFIMKFEGGSLEPYTITSDDMLADDWILIE